MLGNLVLMDSLVFTPHLIAAITECKLGFSKPM